MTPTKKNLNDDSTFEHHHSSKLSNLDRLNIHEIYRRALATQDDLAEFYGVSRAAVHKVIRDNRTIQHLIEVEGIDLTTWQPPEDFIRPNKRTGQRLTPSARDNLVAEYRTNTISFELLGRKYGITAAAARGLVTRREKKAL